jgi:Leucine-rich repeat (LRR) protein
MEDLMGINLSGNELVSLPPDLFKDSNKVEVLSFSYNQIKSIDSQTFSGMESLKSIYLTSNEIEHLQDDWFNNNYQLERLDLNFNSIKNVTKSFFHQFYALESITFAYNSIEQLPENLLEGQEYLKEINFKNNKIRNVQSEAFIGISSNWKSINLENNICFNEILKGDTFADVEAGYGRCSVMCPQICYKLPVFSTKLSIPNKKSPPEKCEDGKTIDFQKRCRYSR